jgi:hypothetical protein
MNAEDQNHQSKNLFSLLGQAIPEDNRPLLLVAQAQRTPRISLFPNESKLRFSFFRA